MSSASNVFPSFFQFCCVSHNCSNHSYWEDMEEEVDVLCLHGCRLSDSLTREELGM